MAARITLLCHGRSTQRPSAFASDEPLADGEAERIATLAPALDGTAEILTSPAKVASQTAEALSLAPTTEPALADLDLGHWRGRSLSDVEASEPEALATWMADSDFAGHGGESRAALVKRIASWLEERRSGDGHTVAVTHPVVIQAAMLAILGAPAPAFRNIDVAPLTALDIRSDGRRWAIRSFGRL
jgi:broad specificity phosphatase PhoE